MDAIILAGGQLDDSSELRSLSSDGSKAMLALNGRPMIAWVIDALAASSHVERLFVIGMEQRKELQGSSKRIAFDVGAGGLVPNILRGLERARSSRGHAELAMVACCDIPLMTVDMVDWVARHASDATTETLATVVDRPTMESRFPESRRGFVPLKDGNWSFGELHLVHTGLADREHPAWKMLADARKTPVGTARVVGLGTLLRFLFRRITVQGCADVFSLRLGASAALMRSPYAELAMDLDRREHYDIISGQLTGREG